MKTNYKLQSEFNELKNDIEKWKWVKDNQDTGIIIYLDNDDTFGTLPDPEDKEDVLYFQFSEYIGYHGVQNLLEAYGIKADFV